MKNIKIFIIMVCWACNVCFFEFIGPAMSRALSSILNHLSRFLHLAAVFSCVISILSLAYFFGGKIVINNSRLISQHLVQKRGLFFPQQKLWSWISVTRNGLAWVTCPQTNQTSGVCAWLSLYFKGSFLVPSHPNPHLRTGRGAPWKMLLLENR